uniref:Uncharacterized protein n=1 Tax=Octopus bimaculoides TaxID=37653 RepID=A0A0L8H1R4_OCTBM
MISLSYFFMIITRVESAAPTTTTETAHHIDQGLRPGTSSTLATDWTPLGTPKDTQGHSTIPKDKVSVLDRGTY